VEIENRKSKIETPPAGRVQRQITLPLRKATEIAWKNIRMRLSRCLLVTSGIILALAFLMSILASDAMLEGMRQWMAGFNAEHSAEFRALQQRRRELEDRVQPLYEHLHLAAIAPPPLEAEQKKLDFAATFGLSVAELQRQVGALPGPADGLITAMTARPELIETMRQWIAIQGELRATIRRLNGPEELRALMQSSGVSTEPRAVAADRIQTRWLVGLALLVAFVGILNAMLMSVTERFREIGTMKCLGALDGFIVKLFVIESLFQGIVGTLIGIALGLALSFIGQSITYGRFAWMQVPWGSLAAAVGVCFLVGVALTVAGAVYPAWQAARMQPIEAMRVET